MSKDGEAPSLHHIVVPRTARYAMLGEPGAKLKDVWIVCHGYAQLAHRFIEGFGGIADGERLIVAPEALSRFYAEPGSGFHGPSSQVGASWMTSEDRESEVKDYIAYLDALHDELFSVVPRDKVFLRVLGFSQGTASAARWVAAGRAIADQVILWAGSLPTELTAASAARFCVDGRPVLIVAGDQDRFITSKVLDAQLRTLSALGIAVEVKRFSGGHEIDSATLLEIANALPS